jgi:hypothetical protein
MYITSLREKKAWILLPIMIYLGNLHFIYPWLDAMDLTNESETDGRPVSLDSIAILASLLPNDRERGLFRAAYERTWRMFYPVMLGAPPAGLDRPKEYPPHSRFPFQNEKKSVTQGQPGSLVYFEIPEEYVTELVKDGITQYHNTVTGCGDDRKVCV